MDTISSNIANLGEDGFADSGGVKIHYVTQGSGPLVVLVHGIPEFWYAWRNQIPALAKHFQVVAIDQRGINLSDQPEGVENYAINKLVGDVEALIRHFGRERATLIGQDAGGWISWRLAMDHPEMVERLVILNLPHPACLTRELANNPRQQLASEYARLIQLLPPGGRHLTLDGVTHELTAELYSSGFKGERPQYLQALRRSSIDAIINFYKANYPRPPYDAETYPPVKCPVLMIHGLDDPYLLPGALNDTWRYVENELTLVTVPGVGHWVHLDAAELVTQRILEWLLRA